MTHLPDARFADDADPALKHRLQEQQRENTLHVGSHPRILHELCMHVEFVEHCRFILNVLIDCIHTGVEVVIIFLYCARATDIGLLAPGIFSANFATTL